jgi:hypothetical protein
MRPQWTDSARLANVTLDRRPPRATHLTRWGMAEVSLQPPPDARQCRRTPWVRGSSHAHARLAAVSASKLYHVTQRRGSSRLVQRKRRGSRRRPVSRHAPLRINHDITLWYASCTGPACPWTLREKTCASSLRESRHLGHRSVGMAPQGIDALARMSPSTDDDVWLAGATWMTAAAYSHAGVGLKPSDATTACPSFSKYSRPSVEPVCCRGRGGWARPRELAAEHPMM